MTPLESPGQTPGAPPAETPGTPPPADETSAAATTSLASADGSAGRPAEDTAEDAGDAADDSPVDPGDDADAPAALTPDEDEELDGEVLPPAGDEPPVTGDVSDTLVPAVGALLALVAIAALLLTAFVLPVSKGSQNHLPIGVAGPAEIATQLKAAFAQDGSTRWEIKTYSSEASLRKAIEGRNVYGGFSFSATAGTTLISSAASVTVAQELSAIASNLQTQVVDVVKAPAEDPLGRGFISAGVPLLLAGLLPAIVLIRFFRRRPLPQLGIAIGAAFASGAALSALLTFWLGATHGANFWLVTVALTAGLLSVSMLLLGLNAIGGWIGAGIGVAFLVLVSAPLGNLGTVPELISQPWGDLGRFMPTGAASTLLRSSAFFDGRGATIPLAVLGVWALIGFLLMILSEGLARPEPIGDQPIRPAADVLTA